MAHQCSECGEITGCGTLRNDELIPTRYALEQRIAELEAQLEKQWIPVSERYPKLDERVLVWFGGDAVPYMDVWKYDGDCVTHWQPLPAPPLEGTEHEQSCPAYPKDVDLRPQLYAARSKEGQHE